MKNWYNNSRNLQCEDLGVADKVEGADAPADGHAVADDDTDDAVPGKLSNNPFVKMLKGRAKTSWKHWWKVSKEPEIAEMLAAMPGEPTIGQQAQAVKKLFEELPEKDQAEWAKKAAEASQLPVDQCFMCVPRSPM